MRLIMYIMLELMIGECKMLRDWIPLSAAASFLFDDQGNLKPVAIRHVDGGGECVRRHVIQFLLAERMCGGVTRDHTNLLAQAQITSIAAKWNV